MSVSALTNSIYVYTPVTNSQQSKNTAEVSSGNVSANQPAYDNKNNTNQTNQNTTVTGQNSSSVQTDSTSQTNNTENGAGQSSQSSTYYGLTGEEILASRPKSENKSADNKQLTEEEQKQVEELKARDREVKTHEQAHIAAGGSYVRGGASYDYQTGPDGRQYAVGGNVNIDTSPVEGDPQATINKAQVIIKAAMAPAEPSSQDKAVANQARQMMSNARKELMQENSNSIDEKQNKTNENSSEVSENSVDKNNGSSNNSSNNSQINESSYPKTQDITAISLNLTA